MKKTILLLAISAALLTGCSTSYKTGQTPDDVYYSPSRPQQEDEYVQSEKKDEQQYRNDEYYDDRYLRMKVRNRTRWTDLDDWYYYDKYSLSYNYYFGSYHNPYNSWNYYYNPYCCCHNNNSYGYPKTTGYTYSRPRVFNLGAYSPSPTKTYSSSKYNGYTSGSNNNTYNAPRTSNNSSSNNNNSDAGKVLRDIFKPSSSSSNNSSNGSSNNNSSSSSSSSGSSSTPAPVRKF